MRELHGSSTRPPKIKVFMKRPDSQKGYMTWISNNLPSLQRNVEGYIETVTETLHWEDGRDMKIVIVCNEEGRLRHLPYCCTILGTDYVGNILICGVEGDEFVDIPLTMQEVKMIMNR